MLKIVLIGYGELGAALLKGILSTEHELVGILSWDRRKHYARLVSNFWPEEMERLRRIKKIPNLDVTSVNGYDFIQKLADLKPDIILIGSWGEILKEHIIEVPKKYCINCHPSYLPTHRGSNPYASVLVRGEKYTGITFHQVDKGIDTGKIMRQLRVEIDPEDRGDTLRDRCASIARQEVIKLLDDIENDNIILKKQDESEATYYPRLKAEDGAIDWRASAEDIHNLIRGIYPWVIAYAVYDNNLVLIKRSKLIDNDSSETEPGTILEVDCDNVVVATATPGRALLLYDLQVFGLNMLLSKFLLRRMLKPGKMFKNAL